MPDFTISLTDEQAKDLDYAVSVNGAASPEAMLLLFVEGPIASHHQNRIVAEALNMKAAIEAKPALHAQVVAAVEEAQAVAEAVKMDAITLPVAEK